MAARPRRPESERSEDEVGEDAVNTCSYSAYQFERSLSSEGRIRGGRHSVTWLNPLLQPRSRQTRRQLTSRCFREGGARHLRQKASCAIEALGALLMLPLPVQKSKRTPSWISRLGRAAVKPSG